MHTAHRTRTHVFIITSFNIGHSYILESQQKQHKLKINMNWIWTGEENLANTSNNKHILFLLHFFLLSSIFLVLVSGLLNKKEKKIKTHRWTLNMRRLHLSYYYFGFTMIWIQVSIDRLMHGVGRDIKFWHLMLFCWFCYAIWARGLSEILCCAGVFLVLNVGILFEHSVEFWNVSSIIWTGIACNWVNWVVMVSLTVNIKWIKESGQFFLTNLRFF